MAVQYISGDVATVQGSVFATVAIPSATVLAGDVIYTFGISSNYNSPVLKVPPGFTEVCDVLQGAMSESRAAYKIADGGEENDDVTWEGSANFSFFVGVAVIRGADTSGLFDPDVVHASHHLDRANDTTPSMPVLAAADGAMILNFSGSGSDENVTAVSSDGGTAIGSAAAFGDFKISGLFTYEVHGTGNTAGDTHTYADAEATIDVAVMSVALGPAAASTADIIVTALSDIQ